MKGHSARGKLSVADFFCGAGGFSEGFRQKGFNVVFGLDNWQSAIDTYNFNHTKASTIKSSILEIKKEDIRTEIPDSDVIIGSPPCTFFSKSNKAGKGDTNEGILLVLKFFQIIAVKKPKFWILENVPEIGPHIKESYSYRDLNLSKSKKVALRIPNRLILNAADFGVPQKRLRLFCGNFPLPEEISSDKNYPLKKVLSSLPNPLVKQHVKSYVIDPNYKFKIKNDYLSDHFYDTSLESFEWKEAKRLKQDHSYYGRMSFPEDLDRPSRTIMATKSGISREAMIFSFKDSHKAKTSYRVPTVREAACIQSYPITYQFVGNTEETKYRLVGNSVPPLLASSFARAILKRMGIKESNIPNPHPDYLQPPFNLNNTKRTRHFLKEKQLRAKFRMHVPLLKIKSFRVDLDNLSSLPDSKKVIWTSSLHHGTGKLRAKKATPNAVKIEGLLSNYGDEDKLLRFKNELKSRLGERLPDALEFQRIYCNLVRPNGHFGPIQTLYSISNLIDKHFSSDNQMLPNKTIKEIGSKEIPLRIAVALYACKYVEQAVDSKRASS